MKWFKKQYFIIGIAILFILYLLDFLTGGIKNVFFRYLIEKNNPSAPGTAIENPLSSVEIDGQLLTSHIALENYDKIPCANSETEALEILTAYVKRDINSSSYFDGEIKPVVEKTQIKKTKQFYQLTLPEKIYGYELVNIFDCKYFQPALGNFLPVYMKTTTINLGTFNGDLNLEDLDELIWFLQKLNIIQTTGFNQNTKIYSSTTNETASELTRTDEGIYSVFNDTPPFQTTKHSVIYEYVLNKGTRQLTLNFQRIE